MLKKILITGATGLIGKRIVSDLCDKNYFVKVLTTNRSKAEFLFPVKDKVKAFNISDYNEPSKLKHILEDADAIVNLAGANVAGKRWNEKYKKELYDSRIKATKLITETIKLCDKKPECLISASGVGVYGFCGDEIITEGSPEGKDFLAKLCKDWEAEAMKSVEYGVRVVCVRTGIVLGNNEGALKEFLTPFKFFFGAYQGSGSQWLSWIHIDDISKIYLTAIENINFKDAVNGTSPDPVTNKEFTKAIGRILNRNIILPVPEFVLKIVIGEFAENLVTGQRVYPQKLLESEFEFNFPEINKALVNLLKAN